MNDQRAEKGQEKRDKLWKKFRKTNDPGDFEIFRKFRNNLKQRMRNTKIKYFNDLLNTSNSPKFLWSQVKSLGIGSKRKEHVPVVPVDKLVADYANVSTVKFPDEVKDCISKYHHLHSEHKDREEFHFKYVLPEEIITAISSVKSQAKDVDKLPVSFINLCFPVVLPVLQHIFNYSLQNGSFPDLGKYANILPIPKKKQPKDSKDYRPVSILCVLAKVSEKLVHKQVVDYVDKFNILSPYQSGFRKGYSTVTALLKGTDDLRKAMDNGKLSLLALLDLSRLRSS